MARFTQDGRSEVLRVVRRSDAAGAFWAFSPATVARIDAWYEALPDRALREWLRRSRLGVLLLPGPLEMLWWQWIAFAALVVAAWVAGALLSRATRAALRTVTRRTETPWDDVGVR